MEIVGRSDRQTGRQIAQLNVIMLKRLGKHKSLVKKIQAVYFIITGIWPIVHIDSFMAVTGPKTDVWLVHMVGLLSASIGASLLLERRSLLLAVCASSSFALIDLLYVMEGTISPVYLADCALQLGCLFVYACPSPAANLPQDTAPMPPLP